MIRACKICPFYFGSNRRINPRNWKEGKLLIDYIIATENQVNAGVPVDLIIVNNTTDNPEYVSHPLELEACKNYLNSLNGQKTLNGTIKVMHRRNVGISFGAHNAVFERHVRDYDYWFFMEDDTINTLDNYYLQFIDQLNSNDKCAFVAMIGLSYYEKYDPEKRKFPPHAHSGAGCTSTEYLLELYEKNGSLPFYNAGGMLHPQFSTQEIRRQFWGMHIEQGEMAFTCKYGDIGYEIEKFSGEKPYIRWTTSDKKTDIKEWGTSDYVLNVSYEHM